MAKIKVVLAQMIPHKAQGTDGFNAYFSKNIGMCWGIK